MARPQKSGIDYFPLDVYMEQDDKIALIEAKYGIVGFGVIIKLYKKVYANKGYYYEWNDRNEILFTKYAGVDQEQLKDIIKDSLEWEIFDKKIFNKYQILTSKRIQKTYLDASYRKKQVELYEEFLINGVNGHINKDNVIINSINDSNNPQIKVKKTKIKESKVKHLDHILLTEDEYKKLVEKIGELKTKKMIDDLDYYIENNPTKGKKYKSHYRTILKWYEKDKDKKQEGNNGLKPKTV